MSQRQKNLLWWVAIAGVPIGYVGIWLDTPWITWLGIGLSLPLFVMVLPFCVFLLAAHLTRPLWLPFYRLAIEKNGAPFHPGDLVYVKHGPHRGRVVSVYDVWEERDEVRVDLGVDEKADLTDVVSYLSVSKIRGCHPQEVDSR